MKTFEVLQIVLSFISILILFATVYYIANGPKDAAVKAVNVGRQLNNEEQKDNAKRDLFLTLFSLRGNPTHYDFVFALNKIEIVFAGVHNVITAWHNYFDSLQIKGQVNALQTWERLRIELYTAMAEHLGYRNIRQIDMTRDYSPERHGILEQDDKDFRAAVRLFLSKMTESAEEAIPLHKLLVYFYEQQMNDAEEKQDEAKDEKQT